MDYILGDLNIKHGDYNSALIHLAWFRDGKERIFLFGMVELIPAECLPAETSKEIEYRVTTFGRQHFLYVRRFAVAVEAAIAWYCDGMRGDLTIPAACGQSQVKLQASAFDCEPPWPNLVTTRNLPFHSLGTVRAHHLLQPSPPPGVMKVFTDTDAVKWLSDRLFFDFVEYPEYLGSVTLVAPNPVFREFHQTLGILRDGGETSDCQLIARAGRKVAGLNLYVTEHRPTGFARLHHVRIDSPHVQIPQIGRTEQVSYVIDSPEYGVLDWHEPVGFIRTINTSFGIITRKKIVKVPDTQGRSGEMYEQSLIDDEHSSVIGDAEAGKPITEKLFAAKGERERRSDARRLDQKWFHGEEQEARTFIRGLIGSARKRVMIVDPYFSSLEFLRFALATHRSEITVRIVTAADENLKQPDRIDQTRDAGEVLLSQIKALHQMGRFEVLVMTGKPQLHDRFLVIDDEVWLSGNSLHSIGERAGMIIKLPNPGVVLDELEKITSGPRVVNLEKWVKLRLEEKQRPAVDNKAD
jgi:hypothetical protein